MTSVLNPQKRLAVRLALITGSTLATLVGAQGLISMDAQVQAAEQAMTMHAGNKNLGDSGVVLTPGNTIPNATAIRIAPNIIILRHPGRSPNGGTVTSTLLAIVPPVPQELSAPAPIIIPGQTQTFTQPSAPISQVPVTRSSR